MASGAGVKERMKMSSATAARTLRPASRRSSSKIGGWRRPISEAISAHSSQPCQKKMPRSDQDGDRGDAGQERLSFAEHGIEDVAAVELADGKEVEGGGQEAEPAGEGHGVDQQVALRRDLPQQQAAEQGEDQRLAQGQPSALGAPFHDMREGDAHGHDRQGGQEAGQRPGQADVEQRPLRGEGRADLDEGAEGADQGGGGDEMGQGGLDAVAAAGEEMSHFVDQQDAQQRQRVGEAPEPGGGMAPQEAPESRRRRAGSRRGRRYDTGRR